MQIAFPISIWYNGINKVRNERSCAMLLDFFATNYVTFLLLLSMIVIMFVNRKIKLPASEYFYLAIAVVFVLSVSSYMIDYSADVVYAKSNPDLNTYRLLRWISSMTDNILRPVPIMLEVMLISESKFLRRISVIPEAVNFLIYLIAPLIQPFVFGYRENDLYIRGPMGYTVFIVQFFYLFMLLLFSFNAFKNINRQHSLILIIIVLFAAVTALLETNGVSGYANTVTALAFLLYYFYLTMVYQHKIQKELSEKELQLAKDRLFMLRNQIQPHFILNSLALIRSLAKRDKTMAVECIDCFSDYLKLHLRLIQSDDVIPFEQELENVRVYITLAQMDYTRKMDVVYSIKETDFSIPALSLEPIVENALRYGIKKEGGTVTIATTQVDDFIIIRISDTGGEEIKMTQTETTRLGIGIENTRKRLAMQCQGTLSVNIAKAGTNVFITLPKNKEQENEHSDS